MLFLKASQQSLNWEKMREIHYLVSYPSFFKICTLKCCVAYLYFLVTHFLLYIRV